MPRKLTSLQREKQGALFEPRYDTGKWKPPQDFPEIQGRHKEIWLDVESTGKDKFKDLPVGIAVSTLDKSWYLPFGHLEGGNLDEEKVRYWASKELRGIRINNINTGFDAEVSRNWGVDLEEQGCSLHDVAHAAALIDEHRFDGMNLDDLGHEYVGRGKFDSGVSPQRFCEAHSSLIGPYAEEDTALARDIDLAQRPMLEKEDLTRVMALEDELIWANNHMERNGLRLDMPLLEKWRLDLDEEYQGLCIDIWERTGVKLRPNVVGDWGLLMDRVGLKRNKTGEVRYSKNSKASMLSLPHDVESYTEEVLQDIIKKSNDPIVRMGLRMRRLSSLKSKYTEKYWRAQKGGRLPFHLYQLRASEEDFGTVVGRYSSANINVQQLFKVSNQVERFCDCGAPRDAELSDHGAECFGTRYIIRQLIIADDGFDFFAVDGSQLQFRLFAHYSKDPTLIARYNDDPDVDFHTMVSQLFSLTRQAAKHNNFAMVLGMGREKLANRLGKSCTCRKTEWWSRDTRARLDRDEAREHIFGVNSNHGGKCPARESNDLADRYDAQFPAAKATMKAVTAAAENRGYVKTLLGRRSRFKDSQGSVINHKFYSAFAGLLQGSEADVVKTKINTIYRERKTIGVHKLRAPVHDEITGDISKDPVHKGRFEECCAQQELDIKVPIIWNAGFGRNWKETK